MILIAIADGEVVSACPHTRGDDPKIYIFAFCDKSLVPIRVGMITGNYNIPNNLPPCPHTRGDDPNLTDTTTYNNTLSPYAWG